MLALSKIDMGLAIKNQWLIQYEQVCYGARFVSSHVDTASVESLSLIDVSFLFKLSVDIAERSALVAGRSCKARNLDLLSQVVGE